MVNGRVEVEACRLREARLLQGELKSYWRGRIQRIEYEYAQ